MGFNVMNYQSTKTVKLSDAYVVEIRDVDEVGIPRKFFVNGTEDKSVMDSVDGNVDCFINNAIQVKIPSIKSTAEQLKYNTFTHTFVRLDLDSAPDTLDITLYETSDEKVKKLVNYLLEKNGFNERSYGTFDPFAKLSSITVYVMNNNLTAPVFSYDFEGLRLVNYEYNYSYDYKDSSLPTVTLSFSYESFSYGPNSDWTNYDDSLVAGQLERTSSNRPQAVPAQNT